MRKAEVGLIIAAAASVAFIAGFGASARAADDKGGGVANERLPGSRVTIREAVQGSRLIVVAKDVDMGPPQPDFTARADYGGVKFRVVKSLKGEAAAKDLSSVLVVVRTYPPEAAEATPDKDKEYVFFLGGPAPDALRAIKVLRATEDNVRSTKEALKTVDP